MIQVVTSKNFEKEAKRLIKKYGSLGVEIKELINNLKNSPILGSPIGKDCYKIRLAIKSKGKGKSGGARVITFVVSRKEKVVLLSIYDKSEAKDISNNKLSDLLNEISNSA